MTGPYDTKVPCVSRHEQKYLQQFIFRMCNKQFAADYLFSYGAQEQDEHLTLRRGHELASQCKGQLTKWEMCWEMCQDFTR